MKYKKYFKKNSLKQEGIGEHFLNEIASEIMCKSIIKFFVCIYFVKYRLL